MKKRRLPVLVIVLIVLLAAGTAFALLDPAARVRGWATGQPFYQGRAAVAWEHDLRQGDEVKAVATRTALAEGKADAVPVCAWLLGHAGEPEVRTRAADALGSMKGDKPEDKAAAKEAAKAAGPALVAALGDPDPLVRGAVTRAVGSLAPDVPGAVPDLVKLFPDIEAIRAVANFGPAGTEAVPQLIPLLRHEDAKVRWNAARTLGKIGPGAAASVPDLVALMGTDPDADVREHCAESLGQIKQAAPEVVPALIKALKDPAWKVRKDAARSLGQLSKPAKVAIPELRALLKDENETVRQFAAAALKPLEAIEQSWKRD